MSGCYEDYEALNMYIYREKTISAIVSSPKKHGGRKR